MGWAGDTLVSWFCKFVMLFFMISCFSLCCGYYEKMKRGRVSPNEFYTKRYRRLLPFFGFMSVLGVATDFSGRSVAEGFMNCTLTFGLLPDYAFGVIGVGWFLGYIFLFYMLFPFFVFLLDNKRRAWLVFGLALVVNYLCQEYFLTDFAANFNQNWNMLYSAPYLLAGGLCFLYRDALHRFAAKAGNYLLAACLAMNALYFAGVWMSAWTLHSFYPLLAVFTPWLIYSMGPDHRWMHNKVMDFLSGISLEIYLCHPMMYRVVETAHLERVTHDGNLLFAVTCVAGIGLTIAFSWCAKRAIQFGCHRLAVWHTSFLKKPENP